MLARLLTAALVGIEAVPVAVEVDVSPGLPGLTTVGLPDATVRESRDRVRTAIRNSGFPFPLDRITVSLAPADLTFHVRKRRVGRRRCEAVETGDLLAPQDEPRGEQRRDNRKRLGSESGHVVDMALVRPGFNAPGFTSSLERDDSKFECIQL